MRKQLTTKRDARSLEETLFAFRRKFSDVMRHEAECLHCPLSQIDTLSFIAEKGNSSMKEIADHLKITPPSATAIVEAMQKKKLITRTGSVADRRTIRVALTHTAWKLFRSFHERKFAILTKMLSKLRDTERKQLIKILTILIRE
jgi:DNA-binding MarR family transcriptional regulator